MKPIRTKAIVLRRTDYGEADRIVQFLTPGHGILSAMARGVRKEKSRLAGGIELFSRCDISLTAGRGDLMVLTSARADVFYKHIISDYDRLQFGYDTVKQVARAASNVDEPAYFDLLDQALDALNDSTIDIRLIKTWFWVQLAILHGVGLNLATDASGARLQIDEKYVYSESDQAFVRNEKGSYSAEHIKILRVLSAQSPKVAAHVRDIDHLLNDCLWVAERSLAH